ncbi:hNH endonuclease [Escherichia marmotae]|uniref:hNH endonuclease n=1 Tax=Escherichia marmotae TaxID=1499973 RepID=UPI00384AFAAB
MESNIKGLVSAGHEMASELKAECGAVDMRSVAKLISDLATQLEVQLVRANALAAENAGMKSVIEYCITPDNQPEYNDQGMGCGVEDHGYQRDGYSACYYGWESAMERVYSEVIPDAIPETTATDAFLAEVRAQGVDAAIEAAKNLVVQEYEYKDFKAAQSDCCMHPGSDLVGKVEMTEWLVDFAAQLRKGGNQ